MNSPESLIGALETVRAMNNAGIERSLITSYIDEAMGDADNCSAHDTLCDEVKVSEATSPANHTLNGCRESFVKWCKDEFANAPEDKDFAFEILALPLMEKAWKAAWNYERREISGDFDIDKARKDLKPAALELLKQPIIQSLLYDIDLLPEQIKTKRHWFYMLQVLSHMDTAQKREMVNSKKSVDSCED